ERPGSFGVGVRDASKTKHARTVAVANVDLRLGTIRSGRRKEARGYDGVQPGRVPTEIYRLHIEVADATLGYSCGSLMRRQRRRVTIQTQDGLQARTTTGISDGKRHIDKASIVGAQNFIGRSPANNVLVNEFVETAAATKAETQANLIPGTALERTRCYEIATRGVIVRPDVRIKNAFRRLLRT